jgi:hypothetical protein
MDTKVKQNSETQYVASIKIPPRLQGIEIPKDQSSTKPRNGLNAHPLKTGVMK